MEIEKIEKRGNLLHFVFEEEQGKEVLGKVLQYIYSPDRPYYYIIFGDYMGSYHLSTYKKKYPLLEEEEGFVQLQEEDIHNTDLIYDILISYHISCLYINNDSNFLLGLEKGIWRKLPWLKSGYKLYTLIYFIDVLKDDELPAWDLSRLGIEELPKPPEPPKKEGILHRLWRIIRG